MLGTTSIEPPSATAFLGAEQPIHDMSGVDAFSILIFGDLLLQDFARVETARRGLDASTWAALVKHLDRHVSDAMTPAARYLNVVLKSARDVVVAHTPHEQYPSASWGGGSGDFSVGRVSASIEAMASAKMLLGEAVGRDIRDVDRWTTYADLSSLVIEEAPMMTFEQAGKAKRAFKKAGFHVPPTPDIVDWMLRLLRAHLHARGIEPIVRTA